MLRIDKIEVKKSNLLTRAALPLNDGEEIDLISVFDDLVGTPFVCKYNPETSFPGLHVKVGAISFWVFKSGKVTIAGNASEKKHCEVITFFWIQHLKQFVVHNSKTKEFLINE